MYKILIKNTETNREFIGEFTTEQDCLDWHITKKYVHGDEDLTPPTAIVTIEAIDNSPKLISDAWEAANTLAQQIDDNSRISLLWIANDPATSTTCKGMINDVQEWWSNVWIEYGRVKALIQGGTPTVYNKNNVGDCPYSIWQISAAR